MTGPMGEPAASARILRQVDELVGEPAIRAATWAPLPNNFALLLFPRGRDVRRELAGIRDTTAALNRADLTLLAHFEARWGTDGAAEVIHHLRSWRATIDAGANLLSCDHALRVLELVGARDRLLRDRPDVLARFRNVPEALRTVVRLNLHLPQAATVEAVAALIDRCGGTLPPWVSRVEVGKAIDPRFDRGVPPFPTVMVYVDPDPEVRPDADQLACLMEGTVAVCEHLVEAAELLPAPEYAAPFGAAAHLTQGYRLYKRYLDALGLLAAEYDEATGFALARADRCREPVFGPSLRAALGAVRNTPAPTGG